MKVKVLKSFRDKNDTKTEKLGKLYKPPEIIELPKKKADYLEKLGLVKKVVTKKVKPQELQTEDKNAEPKEIEKK